MLKTFDNNDKFFSVIHLASYFKVFFLDLVDIIKITAHTKNLLHAIAIANLQSWPGFV